MSNNIPSLHQPLMSTTSAFPDGFWIFSGVFGLDLLVSWFYFHLPPFPFIMELPILFKLSSHVETSLVIFILFYLVFTGKIWWEHFNFWS